MAVLNLVYGPDPIFKQKALPVQDISDDIRTLVADMFDTLYYEQGLGLGANMIGVLRRIAVVDLQTGGERQPLCLINPEIVERSQDTQSFEESSLCFPFISAVITRPRDILVRYQDEWGQACELRAEGLLSTVIQHEIDYLDGVVYLDYLSKLKRDRLLERMFKAMKRAHQHHGCGAHCGHDHH